MSAAYIETVRGGTAGFSLVQGKWREKVSEYFWFSVCLVLFMILGPFAAPIALGFVLSSQSAAVNSVEPEQAVD